LFVHNEILTRDRSLFGAGSGARTRNIQLGRLMLYH
jgi:hypothetical protein